MLSTDSTFPNKVSLKYFRVSSNYWQIVLFQTFSKRDQFPLFPKLIAQISKCFHCSHHFNKRYHKSQFHIKDYIKVLLKSNISASAWFGWSSLRPVALLLFLLRRGFKNHFHFLVCCFKNLSFLLRRGTQGFKNHFCFLFCYRQEHKVIKKYHQRWR